MKSRIFIEIGYTNFKIKNNNKIILINNCKFFKSLKSIIKFYINQKYEIYILNNNLRMTKKLLKLKTKFNLFLFDKFLYTNTFNIPSFFQIGELGEDLIFLLDYLMNSSEKNIILLSSGTTIVSIIKKNNIIDSIMINLGIENQINTINKKLNWSIQNQFTNKYIFNSTNNAVNLGIFTLINGIIKQIQFQNQDKNFKFIFCGNGFDSKWKKFLLKTYHPIIFDNNLVLNLFIDWVNNNLKT